MIYGRFSILFKPDKPSIVSTKKKSIIFSKSVLKKILLSLFFEK